MTEQGRSVNKNFWVLAWGVILCVGLVPQAAAQETVETPEISPATATGIPPAGLDVTIACPTAGATIYYTTDGSEPTDGGGTSQLYGPAVHIDEELGLTATKSVVVKAKAFKDGMTESATDTASYTNFAEAEFAMKLAVAGTGDTSVPGLTELEFGLLTGATDNYDTGIDGDLVVRGAARDNPPVPQLPVADIRFITADSLLTGIDYRSRVQPKLWKLQAQLFAGQLGTAAEITLTWGHDVAGGFGLPPATVPYLWLYRNKEITPGVYESSPVVGGDLTIAGSITINRADWPAEPDDYDGNGNDLYRTFYVVYRNAGALTTTLAPADAITDGAKWAYRATDAAAFSEWKNSGDSETVHAGEYEVKFKSLAVRAGVYYPPPNQLVTVTAEQTTAVTGTYLDAQSTAELAPANDKYDPAAGTVDVNCTFTYSPDVTLTSLTWEFPAGTPPADWTITALSGTDAAAGAIQGDNRTVVFSNARGVPASNPIEFTVTFTYPDQGETPPDITFDATVTAVTNAGALTPDVAPRTITPQTATLDVDGDGAFTSDDVVFVSRYQTLKVLAGLDRATVVLLLVPSTMSPVSDAGTIYDTVAALESDLNVDGDGAFTSDDVVFVSRYQTLKVLAGLDRATVVLLLVPSTMSPVSDAGTIYDNISAIDPTDP